MPIQFKPAALIAGFVAVGALAGAVHAQEMDDGDYIRARIAHYREIATGLKAISDEMKSGKMRPEIIKQGAKEINDHAKHQYNWYRPGSGPESEERTDAKPEIWTKPKEFKAAQDRFLAESNAMLKVANAGDMKAVPAQFKALAATCGACHDVFKKK